MQQEFSNDMSALNDIFRFLKRFAEQEHLSGQVSYALVLSVEEFFTNIVKYGTRESNEVLLLATRSGSVVTVCLEEKTSVPFDVTRRTDTQFNLPAMKRKPGGLGIHIAREVLDDLRYEYVNGVSRITLVKHQET
jgi:anti-sigma regulatory factor (Ser/Thr protein kinase)